MFFGGWRRSNSASRMPHRSFSGALLWPHAGKTCPRQLSLLFVGFWGCTAATSRAAVRPHRTSLPNFRDDSQRPNDQGPRHVASFAWSLPVFTRSLPLPTYLPRKNGCSSQRGWRPLANRYHSWNYRIYKEESKTRNEAPYAEVSIGKIRQNTTRCTAFEAWIF